MAMRRAAYPTIAAIAIAIVAAQTASQTQTASIQDYIKRTWSVLTRSNRDLAKAAVDPKFQPAADGRWPVYVARSEKVQRIEEGLRREMAAPDFRKIAIHPLPEDAAQLKDQGLLYLPHPYVVPGGRFNEMYGWDSYFIQIGLLRDGEIDLARNLTDNFLYEIR